MIAKIEKKTGRECLFFSFVAYVTVFMSSPVSAVRPIAHNIMISSSRRQVALEEWRGGAKKFIFIGKLLCSFFFSFSFNRTAVALLCGVSRCLTRRAGLF